MALLDETQSSLLEVLQRMMRTMSTEESSSFSRSGARDDASLSTRRRRVYSYGGRRGTPKKSLEPYLKDQLTEPKVLVLSKDDFLNNKTSTKRRPFVVAAAAASPRRRRAPGGLDDDLDDLDDDEGDAAASARKEDDEEEAYALTTLSIKHDIIEFAIDEQDDEETNVFAADASSHFDGDGSEERPSFYDDDDVARAMHEQAACLEATLAATNDAKKTHDAVVAAYTAALAAKARATAGRVDVEVADTLLCRSRVQYRSGKLDAAEADQLEALKIRVAALGAHHPAIAVTMTELATTLEKKRDYAEAARYAEYALDIRTVTLGTKHPSFAAAAKLAASLCAKNADHIAARDRFHMAADCYKHQKSKKFVAKKRRALLRAHTHDLIAKIMPRRARRLNRRALTL